VLKVISWIGPSLVKALVTGASNRDWFAEEAWMSADEVISLSLSNFADGGVIYIPGEYNQKILSENFANSRF